MAPLDVRIDAQALSGSRLFRALQREQLPFAMALALTRTSVHARDEVRARLGDHFTLRNQRTKRGIRNRRAEKRDWPRMSAGVGSLDDFMVLHATGGLKRAKRGGTVLVPTRAIRRTASGKVRKTQRPDVLRSAGKTYVEGGVIRLRSGPRQRRNTLRLLYLQRSSARIDRRWPLQDEVSRAVKRHFPREFKRSMVRSLKSSRRR